MRAGRAAPARGPSPTPTAGCEGNRRGAPPRRFTSAPAAAGGLRQTLSYQLLSSKPPLRPVLLGCPRQEEEAASVARRQQSRAPCLHAAQTDNRRERTQGGGMKLERPRQGQRGSPCARLGPCSPQGGTSGGRAGLTPRTPPGRGEPPPAVAQCASHSHVVEAEQVIAREGPERGHSAAAAKVGPPRPRPRRRKSSRERPRRSAAGNCFRATSCSATTQRRSSL